MEKDYALALEASEKRNPIDFNRFLDEEKLLRLHPHWVITQIKKENHRIAARIRDHATDDRFGLSFELVFYGANRMRLVFATDDLKEIDFFLKNKELHARVIYPDTEGALEAVEEKYNISLWLRGIREYIRLYLTTSINTLFFRLLMNRVILTMTPSQRKISMMLFRFTLLEILVILLIVIGYVIFVQ